MYSDEAGHIIITVTIIAKEVPIMNDMETMGLQAALDSLGERFISEQWPWLVASSEGREGKTYAWPGGEDERIMICVFKGNHIEEAFHRHVFFFFNFAYKGDYGALSYEQHNNIKVAENECYIGQPFTGYALRGESEEELVIIGVLIEKEEFFKTFFSILAADLNVFNFFLGPQNNKFSEEFIHLQFSQPEMVRSLLELMVLEYANKGTDTQAVLQPLVVTLLLLVAREYKNVGNKIGESGEAGEAGEATLQERLLQYMSSHLDRITLKDMASHFAYHPNYLSSLLHQELGKSFSELVLEQRMDRAVALLRSTDLSVETVSGMVGYSNSSNFYKAFRGYFGMTPREYLAKSLKDINGE